MVGKLDEITKEDRDPILLGIMRDNPDLVIEGLRKCPTVVKSPPLDHATWLCEAATYGRLKIAAIMIDAGCPLNDLPRDTQSTNTPLQTAIRYSNPAMVKLFLERGADPNLCAPLISAANVKDPKIALEIFQLMIDHGVDVNHHYMAEQPEYAFTVLEKARSEEIRQLLLKNGAKTSKELYAEKGQLRADDLATPKPSFQQEVISYFERTIGPASKKSLIQIIPTGIPIGIHVIAATGNRKHMTLFTNGLSSEPMNVPEEAEDYRFAEIYIDLPGDWNVREIKNMQWAWPLHWLRKMAQYPHNYGTWLGAPVTLIADEDAPKPFYKGCPFSALFLFADSSFKRSDGNTVQLYRMIPLYASERAYELKHGLKKFMQAMDKHEVPSIIDMNRKPFA